MSPIKCNNKTGRIQIQNVATIGESCVRRQRSLCMKTIQMAGHRFPDDTKTKGETGKSNCDPSKAIIKQIIKRLSIDWCTRCQWVP